MNPIRVALVATAALAAAACFLSVGRVQRVPDRDTRRGFSALLVLSGTWATATLGRLLLPSVRMKTLAYTVGLAAGLATVGAWLYFCSAYTGHEYHRNRRLRWLAVGLFLAVVALKLTNPFHGLYYSASIQTEPFRHMAVDLHPVHWIVTGLAYALTAVGFYLLYEQFLRSREDTRVLSLLVAVTGAPALLDVLSYTGWLVVPFNYEPFGVAVFAVGVLFVVDEQFVALPAFWREEVIERIDEAIVVFDYDGKVRDYNATAAKRFPAVTEAVGGRLETHAPELASALASEEEVVELESFGSTRYYLVERTPLSTAQSQLGRVAILTDVTLIERQRREVQRQNEQFDDFSEAITHELRNTLAIADGYLGALGEQMATDSPEAREFYERMDRALKRMERVISDLTKLAEYGQTLEGLEECDLRTVAEMGLREAEIEGLGLVVGAEATVYADRSRLVELFRNWFQFSAANGAATARVDLDGADIVLVNDGRPLSDDRLEQAFAYGEAVPSAEAGMYLPNLRTLARVHGWTATADAHFEDGVCLRIGSVDPAHLSRE